MLLRFAKIAGSAYALRATLSSLPPLVLALVSRRGRARLLTQLLASQLSALKTGLALGGYSIVSSLAAGCGKSAETQAAVTGLAGSAALTMFDTETRISVFLYLAVRVIQAAGNAAAAGELHPSLPPIKVPHAGALLFALSSAQVMASALAHPETLPKSYYAFIYRTQPISDVMLEAIRAVLAGTPLSDPGRQLAHMADEGVGLSTLESAARDLLALDPDPGVRGKALASALECGASVISSQGIPCYILHPGRPACRSQFAYTWLKAARSGLPLYASLNVLSLLFRRKALLENPIKTLLKMSLSVSRSTAFLATFCALFMGAICAHRRTPLPDSTATYFVAGLLCSSAIMIEQPQRRTELALYVLPRALSSAFWILVKNGLLSPIPWGETGSFGLCMAILHYLYLTRPHLLSPLLVKLFKLMRVGDPV